MTASRSRYTLLSLLAALGLFLAPHPALAGGAKAAVKPLPARTQKVADKVLATATKAQKAKALGNLAEAMSARKDLSRSTTKQAAFLERSVRSQNAAAKRTKPVSVAKKNTPRNQTGKKKQPKQKQKKTKETGTGDGEGVAGAETSQPQGANDGPELTGGPTEEATQGGGLIGRFRRYVAARKAFSNLAKQYPGISEQFTEETRLNRGYSMPFATGGSFMLAAASFLTGNVVLGLIAGGAAAAGGAVEYVNRDRVRKGIVEDMLAATKDKKVNFKLSKQEIATFEAAGWL